MQYRTNSCGELNIENVGQTVKLAGWVQKIRNLGKMQFIDLRDEDGITQIVISEKADIDINNLTTESTISVTGKVEKRQSVNDKIRTGEIEVIAEDIEVLGKCKNVLPFEINSDKNNAREDLTLEYKFLDLNQKISTFL